MNDKGEKDYYEQVADFERKLIADALEQCHGRIGLAAKHLGMGHTSMYKIMKKLRLFRVIRQINRGNGEWQELRE